MAFQQLDPPLPVTIVGKGKGLAVAVVDHGPGHELVWVTALDDSGVIYHAPNAEVRAGMDLNTHSGAPEKDGEPILFPEDAPRFRAVEFPEADAEHAAFP